MSATVKQDANPADDENSRLYSCESEILRNRLLYSSTVTGGNGPNSGSTILERCPVTGSNATYPKCDISLTAANEKVRVKTTAATIGDNVMASSMGSGGGNGSFPNQCVPKVENLCQEDVKPVIVKVGDPPVFGSNVASIKTNLNPMDHVEIQMAIKQEPEPAAVEIPYDRDRILKFLKDYWKTKNSQLITDAQQHAAASGLTADNLAPQRIVEEALFDLFVEHPIMIDGLQISKRAWAKAFYEKDIIQTSKVLFEALFSELEMQQCTLNGKKGTPELSAVKMLAILRAAAWMKNKKQDPYAFNTNIPSHNQFPTNEEREKIEKKVFTERRSQANRKITKTTGSTGEGNSPPSSADASFETHNQGSPIHSSASVQPTSLPSTSTATPPSTSFGTSLSEDTGRDRMTSLPKIAKLDLDTEVVKRLQMLYADNQEGLIGYLLPNTKAILIDGFLVPHEDWTKAFTEAGTDIVKAAWTMFKVLFSKSEILNCTLNGKNGTKELCPVKKLSILRAVTWMKEKQGTNIDIFTFNVIHSDCNCFPSDEDKDKIETKVYTEKRYQACRKLKGQLV